MFIVSYDHAANSLSRLLSTLFKPFIICSSSFTLSVKDSRILLVLFTTGLCSQSKHSIFVEHFSYLKIMSSVVTLFVLSNLWYDFIDFCCSLLLLFSFIYSGLIPDFQRGTGVSHAFEPRALVSTVSLC